MREEEFFESLGIDFADGFFFGEDAFFDEVVGDHGFSLGRTLAIADLEEIQRGDAIDLFDRELGILHVFAFVFEFLASGFEFFINGMESLVFVIAKGFERQGVTDIVVLFMCCRAISLRDTHGVRRYALRAYAPLRSPISPKGSIRIAILHKKNAQRLLIILFAFLAFI